MNRLLWMVWLTTETLGAETPASTGWSAGPVATNASQVLAPVEAMDLTLPAAIAQRVQRRTALFYFSPSCPHCQDVMPEVNDLARIGDMDWLGIATTRATTFELEEFQKTYQPVFEIVQDDEARAFATAVGARSTPSVFIVEPNPADPHAKPDPGQDITVRGIEIYAPFSRGTGGVFRIRQHLDDPFRDFNGYQGHRVCASCHIEEARSWTLTHHAVAYQTLYNRDRATDLKCVGCHVTGIGEPGGFEVGDHGSPLRDVTCESCHGPGGPHATGTPPGERPRAADSCASCHDAEHSIAFSVAKGMPHIDHFAAFGVPDEELRERMIEMASGEAPRPLLAFPEGPTVGAKACAKCHKEAYRAWKKGPHAHALKRLDSTERTQLDCVRCHATQMAYDGPPPSTVDGYHGKKGVSCEACHGPGQAHITAPSPDNIVGLGKSCPECIIEAICTQCHTPQWDPTWELGKRLETIGH